MLKDCLGKKKGVVQKSTFGGLAVLIIFSLLFLAGAYGAEFPTKDIQIIVPYGAGGSADTVSRIIAEGISKSFGYSVVVINRTGGGGAIASRSVLDAKPDGHTILSIEASIIVMPLITENIGYSFSDFTPINLAALSPMNIFLKKDAPWNTLDELIAYAKKNPRIITFATAGPGSTATICSTLFQMTTGTEVTDVPYSGLGGKGALTGVLGGHVSMSTLSAVYVQPHYKAGTVKLLATLYPERYFSDVPTTAELGYPKLTYTIWFAYFVPRKTPQAIVGKLGEIFKTVLKEKDTIKKLKATAYMVQNLGPGEAASYLAKEEEKLIEVIKVLKEKTGVK